MPAEDSRKLALPLDLVLAAAAGLGPGVAVLPGVLERPLEGSLVAGRCKWVVVLPP